MAGDLFDQNLERSQYGTIPVGQPPAQLHSSTSRQAASAIAPHTGKLAGQVLDYIRGCGERGATDPEIAAGLQMLSDTARARRCELTDRGLVRDSGRKRPTAHGRAAAVWVAIATEAS